MQVGLVQTLTLTTNDIVSPTPGAMANKIKDRNYSLPPGEPIKNEHFFLVDDGFCGNI